MKTGAVFLLLVVALPTTLGVPYSSRDVPIEDKIRGEAAGSPVYAALEGAFAQNKHSLVARQAGIIRNDLEHGRCAPNIIIFARGTSEGGNMGMGVGIPLQNAVDTALPGRVIYQGVNSYIADVAGYFAGGSTSGANNMVAQISRAAVQCPGSRVFLSGYSQGAQVTHRAASLIPASLYHIIGGIVVFGDPFKGRAFPGALNNNVLTICNNGDLICEGIPLPIGPHLNYAWTTPQAADYIKARAL